MFTSVEIENFRGFGKLSLQDLGGVNLVVGKNNTGKTSLLEAVALVAAPTSAAVDALPGLFRTNGEGTDERFYDWLRKDGARVASIRAKSEGRRDARLIVSPFQPQPQPGESVDTFHRTPALFFSAAPLLEPLRIRAISVDHRKPEAMVDTFAEAVRAPKDEQQMEELLAMVDPRIKSVRLDAFQAKPFIVVDVGLSSRVPLSHAGQGIYRLVSIFSELLGSKPDVCFIDEIENGIHYTALPAVWKGIAEIAARLNIQVFATTHSRECLVAAHDVFRDREPYALRIIQLDRVPEGVEGRVMDRELIEAAVRSDIEVR